MLTEERWKSILSLLEERETITIAELEKEIGASASTIRRDLTKLHQTGKLRKIHGGAAAVTDSLQVRELTMDEKSTINAPEKERIGRYAARLIEPDDFVYIDAGTTTAMLVEYIEESGATYVTNSVMHARRLARKGCRVFMPGGELKASTEALIGPMAIDSLRKYHFTKSFLGTNGVSLRAGFTTPDPNEALIKQCAIEQSLQCWCLCDSSKFDRISPITFAPFSSIRIITDKAANQNYARSGSVEIAESL
ncbi:MAG: DeoR/GlpR family DNA-binding transcription regulator [Eubacteriales bacterium]|nr:DeoR/GlpR family DNA-binding transcription regulator [Eubacteriales bacterium]